MSHRDDADGPLYPEAYTPAEQAGREAARKVRAEGGDDEAVEAAYRAAEKAVLDAEAAKREAPPSAGGFASLLGGLPSSEWTRRKKR